MIQQTQNKKDIEKIINHPKIYKWLVDDLSPKEFKISLKDDILYLINGEKTGLIIVEHLNGITCQIHTVALPSLWGRVDEFAKEVCQWIFTNTRYLKIITFIPTYNRLAKRLAEKCWMEKEGLIIKSFLKNWRTWDQYVYGLTKDNFLKEYKKYLDKEKEESCQL